MSGEDEKKVEKSVLVDVFGKPISKRAQEAAAFKETMRNSCRKYMGYGAGKGAVIGALNGRRKLSRKMADKKGSLVVVGTGLCFGQMTIESAALIRDADVVMYVCSDKLSEDYLQKLNKNWHNMYQYYADDKPRRDTYKQMTMAMVGEVKKGKRVVAVFYGHPGVFANPTHAAIRELKQEGYKAKMLPGVSAADCLFADLGVDPGHHGILQYEATDILVRDRPLVVEVHVLIWQIGCVGESGFTRSGFKNENLPVLMKRLVAVYGEEHEATHYVAASYPFTQPLIQTFKLGNMLDHNFTGISTLYIPPLFWKAANEEMLQSFAIHGTPTKDRSERIRREIETGYVPSQFEQFNGGGLLASYLQKMAVDPQVKRAHEANPRLAMKRSGLNSNEIKAVMSGSTRQLITALNSNDYKKVDQFFQWTIANTANVQELQKEVQDNTTYNEQGQVQSVDEASINSWISQLDGGVYDGVTYGDYCSVAEQHYNENFSFFTGTYEMNDTDSKEAPQVFTVQTSTVKQDDGTMVNHVVVSYGTSVDDSVIIKKWTFDTLCLQWSTIDDNPTDGKLYFKVTGDDGIQEAYPYPNLLFSGTITTNGNAQSVNGKNQFNRSKITAWSNEYGLANYLHNVVKAPQTLVKAPQVKIDASGNVSVAFAGDSKYKQLDSSQYEYNDLFSYITVNADSYKMLLQFYVNPKLGASISGSVTLPDGTIYNDYNAIVSNDGDGSTGVNKSTPWYQNQVWLNMQGVLVIVGNVFLLCSIYQAFKGGRNTQNLEKASKDTQTEGELAAQTEETYTGKSLNEWGETDIPHEDFCLCMFFTIDILLP